MPESSQTSRAATGISWKRHAFWITAIIWFAGSEALLLFCLTTLADAFPRQAEVVDRLDNALPAWVGFPLGILILLSPLLTALIVARIVDRRMSDADEGSVQLSPSLARATSTFQADAQTLARVRLQVDDQLAQLEKLRVKTEEYERLARLRREEAAAVENLVQAVVESAHIAQAKSNRKEQILFFLLGVAVSIPISIVTNLATK